MRRYYTFQNRLSTGAGDYFSQGMKLLRKPCSRNGLLLADENLSGAPRPASAGFPLANGIPGDADPLREFRLGQSKPVANFANFFWTNCHVSAHA
jgi:hypothetical protein